MRFAATLWPVAVAFLASATNGPLAAQSLPVGFDAVSIRENKSVNDEGIIAAPARGRFTVTNSPVESLIRYAYRVRDYQVFNVPNWATRTRYDVVATYPDSGAAFTDEQVRQMVQTLLAERFGLRVHRETRQLPVYELKLARSDGTRGPQLKRSNADCNQPPATGAFPVCQGFQTRSFIQGRGQTLDGLASALQAMVRQTVMNRTGLEGAYDIVVRWGEGRGPAEQASVEDIAAMMTALEDQLGLRLESAQAPETVVVVDAVRPPAAN